MAEDRPQSADQFASTDTPTDQDETNWGEDWESAFQAEDDAFFSEGKEEDFFLEEKEPTVSSGDVGQGLDSSLEKALSGIPDHDAASGVHPTKSFPGAGAITALLLSGKIAARKQFARLQSFPIFVRIPLYALPLLLITAIYFLSGTSAPPPALRQATTSSAEHPGSAFSPDAKTNGGGLVGESQTNRLHPGKVRKKWAFPAFIIPVKNPASDQPITFVLVDITLITSLAEQEDPPADKKIFVRDIIYQFFQNKPLDELRKYSLARGEMNRELRAWLQKQWPDAPIESIIFHQYSLS
ncbi:MAG: flagellar basal body-associated FliL family protein [Desulfurivibrio sp.]|nr:flagellar basal body-associated FliL family protein [Desulfurivibrio sp.]MBU3936331.1 flagellar basal body-associated FliL family protein [Pseudomonadota bacterium]MBU4118966.1 flagellar basal body-associated FliL family protein [Pseudomonadota bacterium]